MVNKMTRYIIAGCGRSGTSVTHNAVRDYANAKALKDDNKNRL